MAYSDAENLKRTVTALAVTGGDVGNGPVRLPASAQRTLDQIADALGVTTALLQGPESASGADDGVRLAEASELLRAFIRIQDPAARLRCMTFIKQAGAA